MSASAPVVVIATVQVKPGKEDEGLAALSEVLTPTHEEEGCVGYALHRDVADATRFIFVERWASLEALEAHRGTEHVKTLFAKVGPIAAGAPVVIVTEPVPGGDAAKGVL